MKYPSIYLLFFLLAMFSACNTYTPQPQVVTNDSTQQEILPDTESIIAAELPIHFDSTEYLIHTVGKTYQSKRKVLSFESSSYSSSSSDGVSNSGNQIYGSIIHFSVQHRDSFVLRPVTKNPILISRMTFLRSVYDSIAKPLLLIEGYDVDYNNDRKLTSDDPASLFISSLDGSFFKKVSPSKMVYRKWRLNNYQNTIYFECVEDENEDAQFISKEPRHYYYVNLTDSVLRAVEYFPMP